MQKLFLPVYILIIAILYPMTVLSMSMSSTNYRIQSDSINVGGVRQTSANYVSEDTIGEISSGNSSSDTYELSAGYQPTWNYPPGLSFAINENSAPLGTLTSLAAAASTTTFSVLSNAVDGYAVSVAGTTLTSNSSLADIDAMTVPASSSPGNEQFGLNLVSNSIPSVGTDPVGGVGIAANGYNTPNSFKFESGDTIATSSTYSQSTEFTVSYLANISANTVSSDYYSNLTLIVTAQF